MFNQFGFEGDAAPGVYIKLIRESYLYLLMSHNES